MTTDLTEAEQQSLCMKTAFVEGGSTLITIASTYHVPFQELKSQATKEGWSLDRKNYLTHQLIAKRDMIIQKMLEEQEAARADLTMLYNKGVSRLKESDLSDEKSMDRYLKDLERTVRIGDQLYGIAITRQSLGEVLNIAQAPGSGTNIQLNVAQVLADVTSKARGDAALKVVEDLEV